MASKVVAPAGLRWNASLQKCSVASWYRNAPEPGRETRSRPPSRDAIVRAGCVDVVVQALGVIIVLGLPLTTSKVTRASRVPNQARPSMVTASGACEGGSGTNPEYVPNLPSTLSISGWRR